MFTKLVMENFIDNITQIALESIDPEDRLDNDNNKEFREYITLHMSKITFKDNNLDKLIEIARKCFTRDLNRILTWDYIVEDHLFIFINICRNNDIYEITDDYIYRIHLIYASMFPAYFDFNKIPNILEEFDYLNDALMKLSHINTINLEDLCFNIIDFIETEAMEDYDYRNPMIIQKDWLAIADSLIHLPLYERTVIIAYISHMDNIPDTDTPSIFLNKIINTCSNEFFEIHVNKTQNDLIVSKLHKIKSQLNLSQKELALKLNEEEDFLSEVLRFICIPYKSEVLKAKLSERLVNH